MKRFINNSITSIVLIFIIISEPYSFGYYFFYRLLKRVNNDEIINSEKYDVHIWIILLWTVFFFFFVVIPLRYLQFNVIAIRMYPSGSLFIFEFIE